MRSDHHANREQSVAAGEIDCNSIEHPLTRIFVEIRCDLFSSSIPCRQKDSDMLLKSGRHSRQVHQCWHRLTYHKIASYSWRRPQMTRLLQFPGEQQSQRTLSHRRRSSFTIQMKANLKMTRRQQLFVLLSLLSQAHPRLLVATCGSWGRTAFRFRDCSLMSHH
jgi:hypothetical protein